MWVHFDALKVSCHLSDQSHSAYTSFCNVSMSSSVCTSLYTFVSLVPLNVFKTKFLHYCTFHPSSGFQRISIGEHIIQDVMLHRRAAFLLIMAGKAYKQTATWSWHHFQPITQLRGGAKSQVKIWLPYLAIYFHGTQWKQTSLTE